MSKFLKFTATHIKSYGNWIDGAVRETSDAEAEYLLQTFPRNFSEANSADQIVYHPDVPADVDIDLPPSNVPKSTGKGGKNK